MGAGIVIFSLSCGGAKSQSDNDCKMACIVLIDILYILFIMVWSIIGLIMYNDYYGDACSGVDGYSTIILLGIYSSMALFFMIIIGVISICCMSCKESR